MTLVIDPERIEDAADQFALKVAPAIDAAIYSLSSGLDRSDSMAGDDEAGRSWSTAYDGAAQTVMGVGQDVTNASYKLAGLLEMTWGNHARAEAGSRPGGGNSSDFPHPIDYADNRATAYDVPPAAGGFPGEPRGWSLIRSAVGYAWPSGHQDLLRSAGRTWGTAATAMSDASILVTPAVNALAEQRSPEMADAVTVSLAMQTHICDLSNAYTGLQNACDAYAGFLDQAHRDAGHELESLVKWTIGIESAGMFLSVATAGLAEVGAQGVEAARIAVTAGRVASIIRALISAAAGVCETIGTAVTRVLEISRKLKVLLGARLNRATAEAVAKLPDETKTAEGLAESTLTQNSAELRQTLEWGSKGDRTDHLFNKEKHRLAGLVEAEGGRPAAMETILRSIGDVPDGVYGTGHEIVRDIDGFRVFIRGQMVRGFFKISTAFVPE